jgi:hypothetical protein
MQAKTQNEVSEIVNAYCNKITNPFCERFFYHAARQARIRIARIKKARKKSWTIKEMN